MANLNSTATFKADISNLRSQMQAAAREVRLANSEFKKAAAGMDDWAQSADGLEAKIKQLNKVLEAQKKQVALAKQEFEKVKKAYGENSAEANRAEVALNKYEAALAGTEKELAQYGDELKKAEKYGDGFNEALKEMDDATEAASDGFTVMKGALASLIADGIELAISAIKDLAKETFQVGANFEQSMAKVGAISGAQGDDLQKLTDKAKEMGETTRFSASEAAEAFQYMAMAGWETEDMLGGIDGLMSLAAASGEDLGTTADIVTDALTAMGYSAADAGKFADVLASASANSNTNVKLMGDTFRYAAPLAGTLGYNLEDTAVAIGLMANAGIKGAKSGTALRSIFTRLSTDTDGCAETLRELGVEIANTDGSMRPLNDVIVDMRKAFSGLSSAEQTSLAKTVAGQEAMAGLLAIVNAAPEDFDKLTKAVNNSTGASKDMADTMTDTVNGQVTLLKSKVEGIMIKIFENASGAIREAIDQISKALDKVDWDKFGKKVGEIVKKVVEFFGKIVKNSKQIIETLKTVGKTLLTVFVVNKIVSFVQAIIGAVKTIKALKAALDIAAASSKILTAVMNAVPWVAAAAGVAALVTGIVLLANKTDDYVEVTARLTDAEQEQIDKAHEVAQAYADMKASRDESVAAVQAEFGHYEELKKELDSLVGANGQVKEGYEDRVAFILNELNSAVGTEMQMVDGVIENYAKERQELDRLMETKKAQAILDANQGAYAEAKQKEAEAQITYAKALGVAQETQDRYNAAIAERDRLSQITAEDYAREIGMTDDLFKANQYLEQAQKDATRAVQETGTAHTYAKNSLREVEEAYIGYEAQIRNYEKLASAVITGSEDMGQALFDLNNNFIDAEHGSKESLENQVRNAEESLAAMEKAYEEGLGNVTKETVDSWRDLAKRSKTELEKFEKQAKASGANVTKGFSQGVKSNKGEAVGAVKVVADESSAELDTATKNAETKGGELTTAYANGISSAKSYLETTVAGIASSVSSSLDTDTYSSGQNFMQGWINGVNDMLEPARRAVQNNIQNAISTLKKTQKEGSPSKITYQSGEYFGEGYINGIKATLKKARSMATELAESAIKPLNMAPNINGIRSAVNSAYGANTNTGGVSNTSSVTNNYNLVQNNTSPKALTALETYRARRQQIALVKAVTQ